MVYKELWRWISSEILKEYWRKGGKRKVVNYGNVDFEPSFWPNEIWDWKDIKYNQKNLKTSDFPGPVNITELLMEVIRRKFDQLNINHTNFVDEKFTDKMRKDRQKRRGKAVPTVSQEEEPEADDSFQSPQSSLHDNSLPNLENLTADLDFTDETSSLNTGSPTVPVVQSSSQSTYTPRRKRPSELNNVVAVTSPAPEFVYRKRSAPS